MSDSLALDLAAWMQRARAAEKERDLALSMKRAAQSDAQATVECNRMLNDEARALRGEIDALRGALRDLLPIAESHPDIGPAMREAIDRARSLAA